MGILEHILKIVNFYISVIIYKKLMKVEFIQAKTKTLFTACQDNGSAIMEI